MDEKLKRRDVLVRGAGAAAASAAYGLGVPAPAVGKRRAPKRRGPRRRAPWKVSAKARARFYRPGFETLEEEVTIKRLPVEGRIPRWLSGTLVRNGPTRFEAGNRTLNHWFDGLGMLHAFTFASGRVSYRNRYLRSSAYDANEDDGEVRHSAFASDPCPAIFSGVRAAREPPALPDANVNVAQLGEKFVALTEVPLPVVFDPKTLETLGVDERARTDANLISAHPHRDPRNGEMLTQEVRFPPPTAYILRRFANGSWRTVTEVPTRTPAYIHSFGLTERYILLAEYPFVVEPRDLAVSDRPFIENYRWVTDRGTRFLVVDRSTGEQVSTIETEPFFAFHHINAYERGTQIVVDLCCFDDTRIIDDLYLAKLRGKTERQAPGFSTRRYTLDTETETAEVERFPIGIELPRVNSRVNTKRYRYAYGVSFRDPRTSGFLDQIVKLDVERGRFRVWRERGSFPGEPVFVPSPRARREDDGVLASVVLDGGRRASYLLILDARTLEEIGRASLPHHIPFGFHGELFAV